MRGPTFMQASNHEQNQLITKSEQYLTFFTAGEEYAIGIGKVREIIEFEAVTTVPNTPPWISGVTNLRGRVIPVVDLAVKFGLTASRISKFSCVIITDVIFQGESMTMGVLADSVSQVINLAANEIEKTPPFGTRVKTEYLVGMGALGKKFCLILDIDKVLSADEILAVTDSVANGESAVGGSANEGSADETGRARESHFEAGA